MIMFDLMRVWRVENAKGVEPYRLHSALRKGGEALGLPRSVMAGMPVRPSPLADRRLCRIFEVFSRKDSAAWSSGFTDLPQYLKWSMNDDIRDSLSARGFTLNGYVIESCFVRVGQGQVIFRKPFATLTDHADCNPYGRPVIRVVPQYKRA